MNRRPERCTSRFHVVPSSADWAVIEERDGTRRYRCRYGRRDSAVSAAHRLAHEQRSLLVVHDPDGRAGECFDYRFQD